MSELPLSREALRSDGSSAARLSRFALLNLRFAASSRLTEAMSSLSEGSKNQNLYGNTMLFSEACFVMDPEEYAAIRDNGSIGNAQKGVSEIQRVMPNQQLHLNGNNYDIRDYKDKVVASFNVRSDIEFAYRRMLDRIADIDDGVRRTRHSGSTVIRAIFWRERDEQRIKDEASVKQALLKLSSARAASFAVGDPKITNHDIE